jgi:hypothetical protein
MLLIETGVTITPELKDCFTHSEIEQLAKWEVAAPPQYWVGLPPQTGELFCLPGKRRRKSSAA